MASTAVEYMKGNDMLQTKWSIGDEIIYNSDPEDMGREHLHLGIIDKVFVDTKCDKNMILIQLPYGKLTTPLNQISIQIKSAIDCEPQRVFVYGTLRDDDDSGAPWTEDWISNGIAQDGRLYKYRLYKEMLDDYPFVIRTNNKYDYVNGRLISWSDPQLFKQKLAAADKIEGNLYDSDRSIVDVMDEEGKMVQAHVYYRKIQSRDELEFCDQIPDGDWLKRHWCSGKDVDDRRDTNKMQQKLKGMIRKILNEQNKLIDSLPLPLDDLSLCEWFCISGDDIAVMNEHKTAKKYRATTVHSVFGSTCIKANTDDIYRWKFKIVNGGNGLLVIGIVAMSAAIDRNDLVNEPFYKSDAFANYGYNVFNGYTMSQSVYTKYGAKAKTNDIVQMELNMKQKVLTFYVNDKSQGIAFQHIPKNDAIRYQMAVSLQQDQNAIALLDFTIS
eukprot:119905_1